MEITVLAVKETMASIYRVNIRYLYFLSVLLLAHNVGFVFFCFLLDNELAAIRKSQTLCSVPTSRDEKIRFKNNSTFFATIANATFSLKGKTCVECTFRHTFRLSPSMYNVLVEKSLWICQKLNYP